MTHLINLVLSYNETAPIDHSQDSVKILIRQMLEILFRLVSTLQFIKNYGGRVHLLKSFIHLFLLISLTVLLGNCGPLKAKRKNDNIENSVGADGSNNQSRDTTENLGGFVQGPPADLKPTFASINKDILQRKCTGCHSNPMPDGDANFETYEQSLAFFDVLNPGQGIIMQRVSAVDSSIMPPLPFLPLSTTELEIIQEWVRLGAPNN